jgi:multidrug efflux pump subunit AcrA (membrane-fusion protein)
VQANPQMGPVLGQMLLFGVRAFPVGRQLEGVFEQAIAAMEKDAQTPKPPPPPSPDEIRAQASMVSAQSKAAADQQKMQMEAAMQQQEQQLQAAELQLRAQDQALAERDQQLKVLQLELEQAKIVEAARNSEADRDHDAAMQMAGHVVTMAQPVTAPGGEA